MTPIALLLIWTGGFLIGLATGKHYKRYDRCMSKTLPELYLEKRDQLSEREREAILTAIEWMNKPSFNITSDFINDKGFYK